MLAELVDFRQNRGSDCRKSSPSGNSALTGTLSLLGCDLSDIAGRVPHDNEYGFWESQKVLSLINEEIL